MFFPKVSLPEWLARHSDLSIESEPCDACGKKRETTIPFLERDWIGLLAPECPCGEAGEFSTQTPRQKNSREWLSNLYGDLSSLVDES